MTDNPAEKELTALAGLPVDCAANRAYVASLGLDPGVVSWLKYKNSVQDFCAMHGGPVWVGPELQKQRKRIAEAGGQVSIICLICIARAGPGASDEMRVLSNKRAEWGD